MFLRRYKHLLVSLVLICFGSAITSCEYLNYLARKNEQSKNLGSTETATPLQQVITPSTQVIIREKYVLCSAYRLSCLWEHLPTGMVRAGFNQLTEAQLREKYAEEDGWRIIWEKKRVVLELQQEGLCPEHSKQWHFFSDERGEKVLVYPGPAEVGRAGGEPARVTGILLARLPEGLQQKIQCGTWEFFSWEEVIVTLDSLAEYMR